MTQLQKISKKVGFIVRSVALVSSCVKFGSGRLDLEKEEIFHNVSGPCLESKGYTA